MRLRSLCLLSVVLLMCTDSAVSGKSPPAPANRALSPYEAQLRSAVDAYQNRQYSGALSQLEMLAGVSSDCRIQYYMALCYQGQGQLEQAREKYKWVADYAPEPYKSQAYQGYMNLKTLRKVERKGWSGTDSSSHSYSSYSSRGNNSRHNDGSGNSRGGNSGSSSSSSNSRDDFWNRASGLSGDGTRYADMSKTNTENLKSFNRAPTPPSNTYFKKVMIHVSNGSQYDSEKRNVDRMRGLR